MPPAAQALLAAWIQVRSATRRRLKRQHLKRLALLIGTIIAALIILEVYVSFGKFPYLYGSRCYTPMTFKTGDWTSGMFILDIPADAKGVELNIRETQPVVGRVPLILSVSVRQPEGSVDQKTLRYVLGGNAPQDMVVPIDSFGVQKPQQLVFTTSWCFTPKNLGVNSDPR